MPTIDFNTAFEALTGKAPFPWQQAIYHDWFAIGKFPQSCNLPTGLGKTSVIAIWLIALVNHPAKMPRRLGYVVNRRTVVDQTTDEVEKYRRQLDAAGLWGGLRSMCASELKATDSPLALSTLRGQFADNREWSADPCRPAVICGTVDMFGSRLLFSGYGVGFKGKPLHAGFLGQDVLLVHDEAHLEPAFQKLIEAIRKEQAVEPAPLGENLCLKVLELSATSRGSGDVFELTKDEKEPPTEMPEKPTAPIHYVWRRTHAKKSLVLHRITDEKKELVAKIVGLSLRHKDSESHPAVLVFVRTVEAVGEVVKGLKAGKVHEDNILILTGTMRGFERDRMADESGVFARFKKDSPAKPQFGTVYLVCTAAGEVGVDISADHMVCDLSPFDSMAQRFGRVNRYGDGNATIDIVYPVRFESKDKPFEAARERTRALLEKLPKNPDGYFDGCPAALGKLDLDERIAAFTPSPIILETSGILFDAWALTTIRDKLPGRPPVEPYLHGLETSWQPPETQVAWREEVGIIVGGNLLEEYKPKNLLEDYPLKPHELLKDNSGRVFDRLKKLKAKPETPVWILTDDETVEVTTLGELIEGDKDDLNYKTVLLPPTAGGLAAGMLSADSNRADDVADEWYTDKERKTKRRLRLWTNDEVFDDKTKGMRQICRIDFAPPQDDEDGESRSWHWFEIANEGGKSSKKPVLWSVHVCDVVRRATAIIANLPLTQELKGAIVFAARFHDHGKRRKIFQTVLGNSEYPITVLAKSGKKGSRVAEVYRHEFGSLVDVQRELEFQMLSEDLKDLVLHLIATHHGRGRPHFPKSKEVDEAFDPDHGDTSRIAASVPHRFARLQRRYGRWGLAYLESLLRAADWAASAEPSEFVQEDD